ncbi:hypothetical protein BpHYR1_022789 [Brachionus plicatilis]|uniref:Uncharacterized protein n=1 Tax=Brachionus plicatilis TaxID=10195 RepID=A0A3M7QLN7_BRAPC|nr:hypothetical protein BpHYR1_022789 [Brachionus plicatilis]
MLNKLNFFKLFIKGLDYQAPIYSLIKNVRFFSLKTIRMTRLDLYYQYLREISNRLTMITSNKRKF